MQTVCYRIEYFTKVLPGEHQGESGKKYIEWFLQMAIKTTASSTVSSSGSIVFNCLSLLHSHYGQIPQKQNTWSVKPIGHCFKRVTAVWMWLQKKLTCIINGVNIISTSNKKVSASKPPYRHLLHFKQPLAWTTFMQLSQALQESSL